MRQKTKIKRAALALEIMTEYEGESHTLQNWLSIINQNLTFRYSIKNTKELAFMFRYMSKVMDVNLKKKCNQIFLEGMNTSNVYYKYIK